ncbi:glycoside hydrolase family 108 protein [Salipiger abyssi]|uniref:Putative secretion activating protein n=1 Tax=Salipiger abyssi TaxID=1250539 RepID=A0A1P8UUS7_9RHOB|nr:glycosyl hydrolase 108 family protein [Salipiger abyssi]APZ53151.1 putative secretion activating protein [Salipiger abyssi]
MRRAEICIPRILEHEGGYVNHPNDPGGATNRGVTIGTLRRLGMDLDGDGDIDIADLKALSEADAIKVYKAFYWDKVSADLLPIGIDYAVADFAVNSGPGRAAKYLQRLLSVTQDGDIGPITLSAAAKSDPATLVVDLCDARLRFMRGLSIWKTFGRGWTARVEGVESAALADIAEARLPEPDAPPANPAPAGDEVERQRRAMLSARNILDAALQ